MNTSADLKLNCPLCSNTYKSYIGVSSHLSDTHKIATPIERVKAAGLVNIYEVIRLKNPVFAQKKV